jgi:hypothetical protein
MICYPWTVNWKAQGQDIDEFKYFKRWFDELSARPAVQQGLAVTASPTEDPESLPAEEREQRMRLLYNQRARPALAEGGPPAVCLPNNQTAIEVLSGFWGWPPRAIILNTALITTHIIAYWTSDESHCNRQLANILAQTRNPWLANESDGEGVTTGRVTRKGAQSLSACTPTTNRPMPSATVAGCRAP